jgi:hypothetical protein
MRIAHLGREILSAWNRGKVRDAHPTVLNSIVLSIDKLRVKQQQIRPFEVYLSPIIYSV